MNSKYNVKVTKKRTYNVQLKLCCLLMNINKFVNICGDIINKENNYYKMWMNECFDFYNFTNEEKDIYENDNNDIEDGITNKTRYKLDNIVNMRQQQKENLINIITTKNFTFSDDINNKKKRLIFMDFDEDEKNKNNNDENYEIQYIIKHKNTGNDIEYFVKWRGYKKKDNSWVKASEFNEHEMIKDYWKSIQK